MLKELARAKINNTLYIYIPKTTKGVHIFTRSTASFLMWSSSLSLSAAAAIVKHKRKRVEKKTKKGKD